MSVGVPFSPKGPTVTFVGATTAPLSVQCLSTDNVGNQQYILTNIGSNPVFVGWGANDAIAKQNAVIPTIAVAGASANGYMLLNASQVTITAAPNQFFTGTSTTSTSQVFVTPGYGE